MVLKILQHDKIWGDNPLAPNSGGRVATHLENLEKVRETEIYLGTLHELKS